MTEKLSPGTNQWHFMGVDPGKTGAYAVISGDFTFAEAWEFGPELGTVSDRIKELAEAYQIALCCIEQVGPDPKWGKNRIAVFLKNAGHWEGILACTKIPYFSATPRTWQRGVYDSATRVKDTKLVSLAHAKRRFPMVDLSRKKDHGKADALNMALWARKKFFVERGI